MQTSTLRPLVIQVPLRVVFDVMQLSRTRPGQFSCNARREVWAAGRARTPVGERELINGQHWLLDEVVWRAIQLRGNGGRFELSPVAASFCDTPSVIAWFLSSN